MATDPLRNVLDRLDVQSSDGHGQYYAKCPCRTDDTNASLEVKQGDDAVVLHCFKADGCSAEEICKEIGIELSDLWEDDGKQREVPVSNINRKSEPPKLTLVATYKYYWADGELAMEVRRFTDPLGKKTFRQRHMSENGRWINKGPDKKPLYRLPQVMAAAQAGEVIDVMEGEKDADAWVEHDQGQSTCNPGGSAGGGRNKWTDEHSRSLRGASLVNIIVDNDKAGYIHGQTVRESLIHNGVPNVMIWRVPTHEEARVEVPADNPLKDPYDLLAAGLTRADLVEIPDIDALIESLEELPDDASEDERLIELLKKELRNVLKEGGDPQDVAIGVRRVAGNLLVRAGSSEDVGRHVEWNQFLDEKVDLSYDWVIPNLLERGDRVIVVAEEGAGKTTLARQVALLSSAGIHPFKRDRMKPVRTLMIDLENPERIIRRATGKIYEMIKTFGHDEEMQASLVMKPDGMNLLMPGDQAIFEEHVAKAEPDILFMGPIYKSFIDPGGRTAEAVSGEIVRFLDYIRVQYDCALWLEHHAPLGDSSSKRALRPFGSAVWSRWSEFGIALRKDEVDSNLYTFEHYRGQREKREWPLTCKRGATWPFEVVEWSDTGDDLPQKDERTDDELNESLAQGQFDDDRVTPW